MLRPSGVYLLARLHHRHVVTHRLDLRRAGGDDGVETHEDLRDVVVVHYEEEVVARGSTQAPITLWTCSLKVSSTAPKVLWRPLRHGRDRWSRRAGA